MLRWTCFFLLTVSCFAQFDPEDAHVDLYFPHLADGGPVKDQWQTSFVFLNPHPSLPANLVLSMFGDDGQPLALDLGGGGLSVQGYIVPPLGSVTLRSAISFPTTMTGYAFAESDLPLQATVLFTKNHEWRSSGRDIRSCHTSLHADTFRRRHATLALRS